MYSFAFAQNFQVNQENRKQFAVGPWGTLEYYPLVLEPPDEYIMRSPDLKSQETITCWRIAADSIDGVTGVLTDAGISADLAEQLTSSSFLTKNQNTGVFEITPPENVILGLTSPQREKLYRSLGPQNIDNPFFQPFALPAKGLESVLNVRHGVPQAQIDRILALCFRSGETHRFADVTFVFGKAANFEEKKRILKTLSRERSLAMRLQISALSDVDQLVNYWGAGGRNKDIMPILKSVVLTSGVDQLDIVHLLPPTPRKLLHTYPSVFGETIAEDTPDCFWTAFGFFSDSPPDRHLDFVGHILSERYERATSDLQFGDLILILDKNTGDWIHACNHIAGNFVFSKNGKSAGRPWVITTLQDVTETYLSVDTVTLSFFRLKPEYRK